MQFLNRFLNKDTVARSRLRFTLGVGFVGYGLSILNILTFAKVWSDTFEFYGIPVIIIYILLPILFAASCWYIGYMYDTRGYWSRENSHINENMNPEFRQICRDVTYIKKLLEDKNADKS